VKKVVRKKERVKDKEMRLAQAFRWEFLRRNEEYQKAYDALIVECKKNKSALPIQERARLLRTGKRDEMNEILKEQRRLNSELFAKYGFNSDYRVPFMYFQKVAKAFLRKGDDGLCSHVGTGFDVANLSEGHFIVSMEGISVEMMAGNNEIAFENLCLSGANAFSPSGLPKKDVNTIRCRINVNAPKESILQEVERIIDSFHKKSRIPSRKSLSHYNDYLQIFDMKQSGLTFAQIVQKVYGVTEKEDCGKADSYDSYLVKVKRGYAKAKALIKDAAVRII